MPNENYIPSEAEKRLLEFWEKEGIYKFDENSKKPVFSIDTPPPTVSGKMHIGHAFSYSQQDFIARFQRMRGKNVFYPFGTDDNGLPTERLVEKLKNVKSTKMSRKDFVDLCSKTIKEIKDDFINDWKLIGMSCDFSNSYSTIDPHCIRTSQKSFIDLFHKNLVYQSSAPTMWCVQCQTAIAQADLEDKELDSTFNDVQFSLENGDKIVIATTRPELLAACVCIHVNPEDKRYEKLIGKEATVPLFNQKVKIYTDTSVDMAKGTGILMICSYGDKYDVEAINKRRIEPRIVFTKDGKLNSLAGKYESLSIKDGRKQILSDLESSGLLSSKKPIKHTVNVHERCGTEIEFLSTKQWFVKILDNKKKLIDAGKKINWYPDFMKTRYNHWIDGLQWDWCISRQRHFGVPFPVWACKKCKSIIVAEEENLPVDPLIIKPKNKCKCGSNEFDGEVDVMDTWATSSVTPQIILNWAKDKSYNFDFEKVYPCNLRPQAHDIIRTWAFYTIVKGIYHHKEIPWKNIFISGHVLDPKGQSMHKSKGNTVEPSEVLSKYSADALRFWASSSNLGNDLRYLEKDLSTGDKTIKKLWNASKFVMLNFKDKENNQIEIKKPKKFEAFDAWVLSKLNNVIKNSTESFESYEYSKAKQETDLFFWKIFCDNYLEVIKERVYTPEKRGQSEKESALYTLDVCLLSILKLFAPIMPFVTEEIYQSHYENIENVKSIHISEWPKYNSKLVNPEIEKFGDKVIEIITKVRKAKSEKNLSIKTPVKRLVVDLTESELQPFLLDLKAVTSAEKIEFGKEVVVDI